MKKILVSLVSEQTVPNILAAHHFQPDELLFITTSSMEGKGKTGAIIQTLKSLGLDYENSTSSLEVHEDNFFECRNKIDRWVRERTTGEFMINLTCGTKVMSLAAFEYFRDYGSLMFYIPVPKNELSILFPRKLDLSPIPISLRLSVSQYLTAYGLSIKNKRKMPEFREEARKRAELSAWVARHYRTVKNLLAWFSSDEGGALRNHRDNKKGCALNGAFQEPTEDETIFLGKFGFAISGSQVSKELTKSEIQYLTGGWLEEYCYNEISDLLDKGVNDVILGPDIVNRLNRNNEFDVMFAKDNALFTVECKSLDQKEDKKQDILYKIGALQREFGLRVESFLVTTSPNIMKEGRINPSVRDRAKQFNTTIILGDDIPRFSETIVNKLGIQRTCNE